MEVHPTIRHCMSSVVMILAVLRGQVLNISIRISLSVELADLPIVFAVALNVLEFVTKDMNAS